MEDSPRLESEPELSVSAQTDPTLEKPSSRKKRLLHSAYTIGWVCALPKEQTAAIAMLDEEHESLSTPHNDNNTYTLGSICGHNVVIACLPTMGISPASIVANSMINTFQSIRVGLMVGIGGGIPSKVNMGDVVVSQPVADYHGVVQWDMGKVEEGGKFIHIGSLNRPPSVLLSACNRLKSSHDMVGSKINEYLQDVERKFPRMAPQYTRREQLQDPLLLPERVRPEVHFLSWLLQAIIGIFTYLAGSWAFAAANEENGQPREVAEGIRNPKESKVHHGLIASGNKVIKDSQLRDSLDKEYGGHLLCVEMEAAGLMNDFPCIVIRGICDYADSRKEKSWQEYAAAVAAAYAKELLGCLLPSVVDAEDSARDAILGKMSKQIDCVQQTTDAINATTDSIESGLRTREIEQWINPPDPSTNANHARQLHHEGTGLWLLENPIFQSWYSGSRRHIWLHGLAGSGKTVLSTTVLDHLNRKDTLILKFFFDFGDTRKQKFESMLRSLIFQLYQSGTDCEAQLHLSFQAHQNGRNQPKTEALWDVFVKVLKVNKSVSIVLDAMDESTSRDDILKWIEDMMSSSELAHVQILYTSRPEPEFLSRIPDLIGKESCVPLDKQAVNSDIRSWVSAQLSRRRDFTEKHLSEDLLEGIRSKLGDGADGMFRWAVCQLDTLARCCHEEAMEEALISLPRSLKETYERMIKSIPPDRKTDAIRLLQFLVHSKYPLNLQEAKEVIATRIENDSRGFDTKRRLFCETDLLNYSPGLTTIVHDTLREPELHLAHFSVKEYLLEDSLFQTTTASLSITRTCLTYLTEMNGSPEEIIGHYPMARYAARAWTVHAVVIESLEDIVQEIVIFLEKEATFQRWTELWQGDIPWITSLKGTRLYYACLNGLVATARDLIANKAYVNAQGGSHGNALQAASFKGHQKIVSLLLEHGADINAQGGGYNSTLQAASLQGHQEIVSLLLEHGADVNAQGGYYNSALQAASFKGHQKIVSLLLEHGADVNAQGGSYGNALQAASSNDHQDIVRLLLDNGADLNAQGYDSS